KCGPIPRPVPPAAPPTGALRTAAWKAAALPSPEPPPTLPARGPPPAQTPSPKGDTAPSWSCFHPSRRDVQLELGPYPNPREPPAATHNGAESFSTGAAKRHPGAAGAGGIPLSAENARFVPCLSLFCPQVVPNLWITVDKLSTSRGR